MMSVSPSGWWTACHGDVTQLVNSRCCVLVLLTLAVTHVVIVSVYIPDPMPCFCPAHSTDAQCQHMKTNCRTSADATYQVDIKDIPYRTTSLVPVSSYYQYVSLILILQALLFYTPSIIWREIARKMGILPDDLAISAVEARHTKNTTDRESATREVAKHVQLFCTRQLRRRHVSYAFWWLHGSKLALWRIMSKMLYGANVIGQFFLLDAFLGMPFHDYGWQMLGRVPSSFSLEVVLQSILGLDEDDLKLMRSRVIPDNLSDNVENGTLSLLNTYIQAITDNDHVQFHTDIYCDTTVAILGNVQRYTLQCVLPINPLNEIVFKCLWFLLCTAAIITLTSLVLEMFKFFTFDCRRMAIRERLQDWGILQKHDPRAEDVVAEITAFERYYLQRDGLLLIEYIQEAAGDVMADEVLGYLWTTYKEQAEDLTPMTRPIIWTEEVDDNEVAQGHQPVLRSDSVSLEMGEQGAWASGAQQPPPYEALPIKETLDE